VPIKYHTFISLILSYQVQGSESSAFVTLFKTSGGLEYLPGGVASGFRKVDRDAFVTRLLEVHVRTHSSLLPRDPSCVQVKGKRVVRVREVALSNTSLNTGDVFILDAGLKIFVYNGATANKHEKAKGLEVASRIRNEERGGRATITLLEEEPDNNDFWGALGGKINVTNPGPSDDAVESQPVSTPGNAYSHSLALTSLLSFFFYEYS
jgi:advillin